ncbi:MucR family transcriptional regulator [Rhizobium sp. PP-F2F-G48]|nr:MucR family transcriptional regulator [Rhizobium sp. PP-F2F-G48]
MAHENTGNGQVIALAARIVATYIGKHTVHMAQLPELIDQTWAALGSLGQTPPVTDDPDRPIPAVPVRKSIQPDHLLSLEDGKPYVSLKRHLMARYGMTPDDYRTKWNLPKDLLKRRQDWFDGQLDLDPVRLVFIDETGLSTKCHGLADEPSVENDAAPRSHTGTGRRRRLAERSCYPA